MNTTSYSRRYARAGLPLHSASSNPSCLHRSRSLTSQSRAGASAISRHSASRPDAIPTCASSHRSRRPHHSHSVSTRTGWRELGRHFADLPPDPDKLLFVFRRGCAYTLVDPSRSFFHFGRTHTPGRHSRRPESQSGRIQWLPRVKRHSVAIAYKPCTVKCLSDRSSACTPVPQVNEDQVVVCSPDTRSNPLSRRPVASACAFATMVLAYVPNDSSDASFSATAMPVVSSCGPPCNPGNTARSRATRWSPLLRIMAPRGPRSVLCVVVVITGAWGTGDGWTPPTMSPAMCATSATRTAPTSAAISAKPAKSITRGIAVPPHQSSLGLSRRARSRTSSRSTVPVSWRTPYE